MQNYYQKEIECAPRAQIEAWQDERLAEQVRYVWENVPYYRAKMEAVHVTPDDVKGRQDLYKLPFLTKADLREAYPMGLRGASAARLCPRPLHLRHDRQARRRLLHAGRHRPLGGLLRAGHRRRGRHGGRRLPGLPTATDCSPAASA